MSISHTSPEGQAPVRRVYRWTVEGRQKRIAANKARSLFSGEVADIKEFYASVHSLRKTGKHFGLSHERVRQIVLGLNSHGQPI